MRQLLLGLAALLVGVHFSWMALGLFRLIWWTIVRLLQLTVLLAGSGSFWWVLRSYQLQKEQELLEHAVQKFNYYRKYRSRSESCSSAKVNLSVGGDHAAAAACSGMMDAGFQLQIVKRLPLVAYLRMTWGLPPQICDDIAAFVQSIVKEYVTFWYHAISPDKDFPNDVNFLLADMLGAITSRVLEIDSAEALTMVAKSLDLLRLHLGWFREAYAQLADEYPAVFEGETESNLLKRQDYVAAFVQRSPFIHPGCVRAGTQGFSPSPDENRKSEKICGENAEAAYLRHVATQLLIQLKPQLGQQQDTNVFVSIAMNLLREVTAFKILKPLSEYLQPRYANEIISYCLQAFVDEKTAAAQTSSTISSGNSVGLVPNLTLNKLRSTSRILYKASKRSGEQAEAAFQAVVDAVASAASSAAAGAAEMVFEGEDWIDSSNNIFAFGTAVFAANASGYSGEKKGMPSIFAMDDRVNVAKAAKMMNPRGLIPGGLLSHKAASDHNRIASHIDDLKNAKTNIGSSFNSSIGKVKKHFRTLSSHPVDYLSAPPLGAGAGTAARMIRKPGHLFQKAWKRGESEETSPNFSFGTDAAATPTSRNRRCSSAHSVSSLNSLFSPMCDDEVELNARTAGGIANMVADRKRVVLQVEKSVANYMKMYVKCPEMRSSARSRELHDLVAAMENLFMLGFHSYESEDECDNEEPSTPPLSPYVRRRSSVASEKEEAACYRRDSVDTEKSSSFDEDSLYSHYYWEFLARDRPGADALNAHWRFVASQCPICSPSESLVSTRGVQWLLSALVKGSLGVFCSELFDHSAIIELFYDSFALLLDKTLAESVLGALSELDKLNVCIDIPVLLGIQSHTDQDFFGVSPQWGLGGVAFANATIRVLERAWETERFVPMNGWVKASDKRWQELPSSEWVWEDDWSLESSGNNPGESPGNEVADSGWEFAKTFDDNFHEKETKFDAVRRRRWIRRRCQLPPILLPPSLPGLSSNSGVSSPMASAAASKGVDRVKKLKQRFNALTREKKREKKIAANTLQLKSSVIHKDTAESPVRSSTSGMGDSDDSQQVLTKTSAFMKAQASIHSLRRGFSSRSIISSSDSHSLSAKPPIDHDPAILYENDSYDDDLCFRCLNALSSFKTDVGTCNSCQQRVCSSCLDFATFLTYPPPLESSKKAQVCGDCYDRLLSKYKLRIEAHVGKYLVKERERASSISCSFSVTTSNDTARHSHSTASNGTPSVGDVDLTASEDATSLLSPNRAGSSNFEITVKIKDDEAYAWSIIKTFQDFVVLEKRLNEKLKKQEKKHGARCQACHLKGVDYMEMTLITPSLKSLPVATLSYEKQLSVLEQFLQQLLACDTLCQSSLVQKFLLVANANGTSPTPIRNPSASARDISDHMTSPSLAFPSVNGTSGSGGPGVGNAGDVLAENGKWRKGRWLARDANSKESKMRVLQKIEVSLFAVLGEVFEFDGIGLVRRQIFSMTRSFIKAFLGASHFRMLERHFLSFTDPKRLSGWINDLHLYMFSDSSDDKVAPPSVHDMHVLRKNCLEAILASFPSKALSLFGDTACENAALKVHEFLQHEVFVKNLFYSITDELLLHLFPDSTTFKGKKASPAAPNPLSPSSTTTTSIGEETVAASIDDDAVDLVTQPESPILAVDTTEKKHSAKK
ncbi:hypothetical protein PsorP6_001375 [Peronosclerospora sorghi]|uniref:Uncharacterized protein n=1 Tax=Peronosclerospora sorghi TaxID=230839 RepID=A0ACC0WY75_9STRA|nr:hypothetical protein PsorP6_001375 [Peronosclerospora sorghi]